MVLYAYIDIAEFAGYCVVQEDYGVVYDVLESRKEYLKNIGTPAILNEKDIQVHLYGSNHFWVKLDDGWSVKYRFR